jgi:hypothetical protein
VSTTDTSYSPYPDYGYGHGWNYGHNNCGCNANGTQYTQPLTTTQVQAVPTGGVNTGDGTFGP